MSRAVCTCARWHRRASLYQQQARQSRQLLISRSVVSRGARHTVQRAEVVLHHNADIEDQYDVGEDEDTCARHAIGIASAAICAQVDTIAQGMIFSMGTCHDVAYGRPVKYHPYIERQAERDLHAMQCSFTAMISPGWRLRFCPAYAQHHGVFTPERMH